MWSAKTDVLSYHNCSLLTFGFLFGIALNCNANGQQNPSSSSSSTSLKANSAGQAPTAAIATSDRAAGAYSSKLKLGAGDLVELSVYGVPELSTKARVSNTGDLYLPLIDYVHVGDLTLEEAQALIEKRLSDGGFVKYPHVAMLVDEYASQGVTVLGEVARPGVYPVIGDRRLFDVVSAAGGFTEKAGKTVTITHRNNAERSVVARLSQHLERGTGDNVEVAPGDTIVIARAGVVYVVGDVGRPSGFLMDSDSITVLQAIAMAGGTNKTAKLSGTRIIRKTSHGAEEMTIPLKKILRAKAPDLPMRADDILFVPSSAGKTIMYRGTESVLQVATALTVVAAHP